jgi:hypothetical protein
MTLTPPARLRNLGVLPYEDLCRRYTLFEQEVWRSWFVYIIRLRESHIYRHHAARLEKRPGLYGAICRARLFSSLRGCATWLPCWQM